MPEQTMDEQEALLYMESLETPPKVIPEWYSEKIMLSKNEKIIKESNDILIERLEMWDESLSIKDIISMKSEAFKNNQSLLGREEDSLDHKKLIPTTINIQVINNN